MSTERDKERAENKIRKLLALAKGEGATEQEVETAMRQAEALMLKHNIQLADMLAETKAAPTFDWTNAFVPYGRYGKTTWEAKTVPAWFDIIAVGVGRFTDCTVRKHRKAGLGMGMGFYGDSHDVELAVWLLEYLRDNTFWQAHSQKDLDRAGKESFRRGMAARLQRRLYDLRDERNEAMAASGSTALVVVETKQEQRDEHFGFKQETRQLANTTRSYSGYQRGVAAGDKVGLHRPLSGNTQAQLN